ncbi:unnamed protein product [Notodromas monacha]|uniref:Alpha 1,4-glycosyltransferase domain-containing protein n=1 Tax=Notodromas monacha TaxID=399045 RepID=A0A7R9GHI9_9CRUS|nr:unnamed protein product [Notodromas monacha]CAG0922853.1 unnamed protein product [Notodromas monacha]
MNLFGGRGIVQRKYFKSMVFLAMINVVLVGILISRPKNMPESCQSKNDVVQQTLKTLDPSKIPENAIYLMETSGLPMLSPKQLCAVESAALHHPNRSVVMAVNNKFLQLPIVLKSWSERYPNVMFINLDIVQWLNGTILLPWLSKNLLDKSPFKTAQASNALRYVTLFKYGGLYLDTDVIVMRPMEDLVNAVGLQGTNVLNNAVLAFEKHHPYMEACMNELSAKFNPYKWGSNGPHLLTRVIRTLCKFNATNLLKPGYCKGIRILDIGAFYPVPPNSWKLSFNHDQNISASILKRAEQSYTMHYWNNASVDKPIQLEQPMNAEEFLDLECNAPTNEELSEDEIIKIVSNEENCQISSEEEEEVEEQPVPTTKEAKEALMKVQHFLEKHCKEISATDHVIALDNLISKIGEKKKRQTSIHNFFMPINAQGFGEVSEDQSVGRGAVIMCVKWIEGNSAPLSMEDQDFKSPCGKVQKLDKDIGVMKFPEGKVELAPVFGRLNADCLHQLNTLLPIFFSYS